MKKLYAFLLLLFFSFSWCQNLDWFYIMSQKDYFISADTGGNNVITSMAIDSEENVYMVGYYTNTVGFDESHPTNYQLSNSTLGLSFLVKINKNKKLLWYKTITNGDHSSCRITSVTLDKNEDVIISGSARGHDINLNPESSNPIIYNTDVNYQIAIFLNKYKKNGDFVFGNFYRGGSGFPRVKVDENNNIFVVGQYTNYNGYNTDFDLSANTFYLNGNDSSSFLLKNDENGNFISAKFLQNAVIHSFQFDKKGNIVFFGSSGTVNYNNQATFTNNYSLRYTSDDDFLLKIDAALNPLWFQGLGGRLFGKYYELDAQPFDIDSNNNIVVATEHIENPIIFQNKTVTINDPLVHYVLFKLDETGKYKWHSFISYTDRSQNQFTYNVTIANDDTINWTSQLQGIYNFTAQNENVEQIKSSHGFSTLLKLNPNGKLIYKKNKIIKSHLSNFDKIHQKMYFAGWKDSYSVLDPNTDQNITNDLGYPATYSYGAYVQKLDKCYSGTPDGDPYIYVCRSEQKKIKDLFPKTSFSSWYDSPASITPLSGETVLENKKYYAMTQDASCGYNSTRLEVSVYIFDNPPKLVVPNFTFCNLQGKTLSDLKINNNNNIEFFDENLKPIFRSDAIIANKKYYVRQGKQYYAPSYYSCSSDLTEFYVYETSVPPVADANQTFCKTQNPKISNLNVTGTNLKWYDQNGNVLQDNTQLTNNGNYFVTQSSSSCESPKTEITVKINVTPLPTGNTNQEFCSSQNAKISDLKVTGTSLNFYDSSGNLLPNSTLLLDNTSYFVSQTINSCESEKFEIKVVISQNALPANDFSLSICNDTTTNTKTEDLTKYQGNLITNSNSYIFDYFDQNQVSISDFKNRTLSIGDNIFYVKVSTAQGCFKIVQLKLQLNAKPEINLPETAEFCTGKSAELDAGFNPNYTYEWSSGEKTHNINVDKEGTYTLKVTTNFGCQNTASTIVTKSLIAQILKVEITNNNAKIILSVTGDFEYSLDNKNWQDSNEFQNLNNGNFTVYVRTKLGCIIGQQDFSIFNIANSFTPNGDGKNDTWKIDGLENYPNSEVSVYDNQGKRVLYKIISSFFEWDGKLNGRGLPTATYWYTIKVSDGRILNGYLLLKNRN